MAAKTKQLKVLMSGDSKPFQQSVEQAGTSTKKFKSDASTALQGVAGAFGANLGPITGFTNQYASSLQSVYSSLLSTQKGSTAFSAAMKIIKVAMISTGVGALIVAIGSLIAYFTKTQRGADILKQGMAGFSAIIDVLVDRFSSVGEMIMWAFNNPKKAISNLWEAIKTNLLNRVKSIPLLFKSIGKIVEDSLDFNWDGAKQGLKDFGSAYIQMQSGFDPEQQKEVYNSIAGIGQEMKQEAASAMELTAQLQALDKAEISLKTSLSKRKLEIAKLRLISKDESKAEEVRLSALQKASAIETSIMNDRKKIASERASIIEQQNALGESMIEDDQALADAQAKVNELEESSLNLQRRLATEIGTLTKKVNLKTEALKKQAEAELAVKNMAALPIKKQESDSLIKGEEFEPIKQSLEVTLDEEGLKRSLDRGEAELAEYQNNLKTVAIDMSSAISGGLESSITGIGEMLGSLSSTGGGFQAFGNLVATSMADMAISVGKVAIQTGVAALAIKYALKLGNPYVAIAAGVALVALGTAVKGSLSSIADGGSSSMALADGGSVDIDTRTPESSLPESTSQVIQVDITGELTASQKGLSLALAKENARKDIIT